MTPDTNRPARRIVLAVILAVATLGLAACAGNKNLGSASTPAYKGGTEQGAGTQTRRDIDVRGLQGIPSGDRSEFTDPNNPLSTRTIYFDFDDSAIPSRFARAIKAHGRYLSDHPNVHLRLEGHTDERGTREYNVALGERRAKSVEQALEVSGAGADQLSTLSFGEERPAVLGSTESAYAKNRRVELIYTK